MNRTPREVILLYEEYENLSAAYSTSIQRDSLQLEAPHVQWEVEVIDIQYKADTDYMADDGPFNVVLQAQVRLRDPWSWLRGNQYSGEMSLTAFLRGEGLHERLLTINKGQRVRVEGTVTYHVRHFHMNQAELLASPC